MVFVLHPVKAPQMNKNRLFYFTQRYYALSPKARKSSPWSFLPIWRHTQRNCSNFNQYRLYEHDLKLLKELQEAVFIAGERRYHHDLEMERNPEYRYFVKNYDQLGNGSRRGLRWRQYFYVWEYWADPREVNDLRSRHPPRAEVRLGVMSWI